MTKIEEQIMRVEGRLRNQCADAWERHLPHFANTYAGWKRHEQEAKERAEKFKREGKAA